MIMEIGKLYTLKLSQAASLEFQRMPQLFLRHPRQRYEGRQEPNVVRLQSGDIFLVLDMEKEYGYEENGAWFHILLQDRRFWIWVDFEILIPTCCGAQ
jgi:hypothetical protein